MAEEIREGDWISYPVNGLEDKGQVLSVDEEAYGVKTIAGATTWVPRGPRVRKIPPLDKE
jgi:hypothetical protein